jgi:hypothetical protein
MNDQANNFAPILKAIKDNEKQSKYVMPLVKQ